jgi:isopentenyl-diphosphate delta-isomerase
MPNPLDQVILVDSNDRVLGTMDKVEAHRGQAKLHRAISVYLFNAHRELLLQKRSSQKIVGAGQWANTCCGNLRPEENYLECAVRRLGQELGIENVQLEPIEKFEYQVQCNAEFSEYEMDQVFVGFYDGAVQPNPAEVEKVSWVKFAEILDGQHEDKTFAPWFELMLQRRTLVSNLKQKMEQYAT